jgi:hypothetical protein
MYFITLGREGVIVNAEFQFVASGVRSLMYCYVMYCYTCMSKNRSKPATRCLFLKVHAVLGMACLFYRHREKGPGGQATREPNGRMGSVYRVYDGRHQILFLLHLLDNKINKWLRTMQIIVPDSSPFSLPCTLLYHGS